jgi:hypothetical protein
MIKLIGWIAVIWACFHFGIIQLVAVWAMVALSYVAML